MTWRQAAAVLCWSVLGPSGQAAETSRTDCAALFDRLTHDFGNVAQGAHLYTTFAMRNRTGTLFRISLVQPGCGCTAAEPTRRELRPGDESGIEVLLNTTGYTGPMEKTILVFFDQPSSQHVTLTVKASPRPDLTVAPGLVDFGVIHPGQSGSQAVHVTYTGPADFHLRDARSPEGAIRVRVTERYRQAGSVGYEVALELGRDAPAGQWRLPVDLLTDDPRTPAIRLWCRAELKAEVRVKPTAVFFGFLKKGQTAERHVELSAPRAFRITQVTDGGQGFSAVFDSEPAGMHVVRLTFRAGATTGNVSDVLTFHTDLGTGQVVRLTVYAHVE